MGFGTILGMYNLRVFLKKFSEAISSRKDIKVQTVDYRTNTKLKANGFEPGLSELTILKGEEVLLYIDATDDEGYSSEGPREKEAFQKLNSAIDKGEMELALEALDSLVKS